LALLVLLGKKVKEGRMWEEFLAFLKVSVLPALALILTGLVGFLLQQI
jgi:preprotein translocase subunit Sss1